MKPVHLYSKILEQQHCMIPVEGHKHLYRDEKSGAIINTDSHGFSQYKKSKKLKLTQKQEIDSMKKDIEEIKNLLRLIVEKQTGYIKYKYILDPDIVFKWQFMLVI